MKECTSSSTASTIIDLVVCNLQIGKGLGLQDDRVSQSEAARCHTRDCDSSSTGAETNVTTNKGLFNVMTLCREPSRESSRGQLMAYHDFVHYH